LFEEDSEFNQSAFAELLREQHLSEQSDYLTDIRDALVKICATNAERNSATLSQVRLIIFHFSCGFILYALNSKFMFFNPSDEGRAAALRPQAAPRRS
jgi:hypothetical protein